MTNNTENFNQIKRDLIDRVGSIEKFIKETETNRTEFRKLLKDINTRLNGDYMITPPILGHEQRIINLEKVETERLKNKETALKMAIGSITIAVGGAMIWVFNVIRDAFITKGPH